MTKTEIIERCTTFYGVSDVTTEIEHPAFEAFVDAMEDRQYGAEETCNAWAFFREGWEGGARGKLVISEHG